MQFVKNVKVIKVPLCPFKFQQKEENNYDRVIQIKFRLRFTSI